MDVDREFEELIAFMGFFACKYLGIAEDSPIHPGIVSRDVAAQIGQAQALVGLKQATNAALDELSDFSPTQVEQFDLELAAHGIVTLTELRQRKADAYAAVRERGTIQDEVEFHLVRDLLDETAPILAPDERTVLESMLRSYEKESRQDG